MANETATEASSATTNTATETPSPLQETPSSTVENLPQNDGDFATWLSDRLEKFDKGEETAPWDKKEEEMEPAAEKEEESEAEPEEKSEEPKEESEAEEEDDGEETKNMSAAAGAKFKELKTELKEYKAKLAEATKLIEEAKSTPANPEEVETLKAKLAEYEQEIAVTRVEATPEYKRAVIEPTQAILDAASTLAERYKIDARKLVNALREESAAEGSDALTELAGDFSERDRVRLYRMADDLSDVSRRRDYLRENASKAYEERQAQMKAEEEKMEKSYRERTSQIATKIWAETFSEHPVLSKMDKSIVEEVRGAGSEADLLESTPEERAYAVYAGVALPHLVKQFEAATSKVAELEKALSKYKKASPKVSGNTDTSVSVPEDTGFLDAIEKRFALG
jgi:hypothetical protein